MKLRTTVMRKTSLLAIMVSCAIVAPAHAADGAQGGNAQAGKGKVSMCIGCHGIPDYKTAFPEVYRVPMIAGQNAKYIENALNAYKKGERSHPSMDAIAGSLSDQDIADIAAYYANLK
ncbi:c-type cytochrome [Bordetella genomosp. 9]|uniref:Cytochrome C n=1 Tax=Bordetella genomosp. 9 TaxID=1416803 RepID=A0A1W6YXL1_9BORD|nr:cytochrome c [Bordetella genomosp. 9]ARP85704.1 cytochrome C [Bordetella genomosp. 9]ARP89682.1 cytochrome C [Bordetella genomosp. 9]